jgi:hypothetical protein
MPVYRTRPTAPTTAPPAADFSCEGCGKVLGTVRVRTEMRLLPAGYAQSNWPEIAVAIQQHEKDCENLL